MSDKFEQWAIVEIMGHKQLAGYVSEQEIAGQGFVRVDVPELDGVPAFTKLFGANSIYAITPVDESAARLYAEQLREHPVDVWRFPEKIRAAIEAHLEAYPDAPVEETCKMGWEHELVASDAAADEREEQS